jgi:hypothetical protein
MSPTLPFRIKIKRLGGTATATNSALIGMIAQLEDLIGPFNVGLDVLSSRSYLKINFFIIQ